jgi:predicted amidophosphoribosyltransferase
MLLPRTCPLCHRAGPSPCGPCAGELERAPSLPPPLGVDGCAAVLAYEGAGRELVARLKYRNARSTIRWLSWQMAGVVSHDVDVVTWVPTTAERRHERGFDQAELLARAVARRIHRPCRAVLIRGPGPAQTGRTLVDRLSGPEIAPRCVIRGRVLLVDDVITSGTTASVAARALVTAGATAVFVVAAARTPLKRARSVPEKSHE